MTTSGDIRSRARLPVALERLVRTFESPIVLSIRARREAREADSSDDSLLRWGRAPVWGSETVSREEESGGFQIINPKPEQPPQNTLPRIYTEVSRETKTVRVTNPNDTAQYVDVARIESITFRGPDGKDVRFDLKPPE